MEMIKCCEVFPVSVFIVGSLSDDDEDCVIHIIIFAPHPHTHLGLFQYYVSQERGGGGNYDVYQQEEDG